MISPFDMKAMYEDSETEAEDTVDVPPTTVTPVPSKPKRLRPYGDGVLINLRFDLLIPIFTPETPSNAQFEHAENIIKSVANFMGCRVFKAEMTVEYLRLNGAMPPTLTIEKLASRIQHEILALWLATYRKPINFIGGYCADSLGIEPNELADYLARQKAA